MQSCGTRTLGLTLSVLVLVVVCGCGKKSIEFESRLSQEFPTKVSASDLGDLDWVFFVGDKNRPFIHDRKAGGTSFRSIEAHLVKKVLDFGGLNTSYSWRDGTKRRNEEAINPAIYLRPDYKRNEREGDEVSKLIITLNVTPEVGRILIPGACQFADTRIEAITAETQKVCMAHMNWNGGMSNWVCEVTITKPGTRELRIELSNIKSTIDGVDGIFAIAGVLVQRRH